MILNHLFWLLILAFPEIVYAHGGGLNSKGCHNEKKTGGYHCHNSPKTKTDPISLTQLDYDRTVFSFRSYKPNTSLCFYTGSLCSTNIDHVVSLKDAYESGAFSWNDSKKTIFANDPENHVPSCGQINSSKGSAGPKEFLHRSIDGVGLDYQLITFCEYVAKYHTVKVKYDLSFSSNSKKLFADCGINI